MKGLRTVAVKFIAFAVVTSVLLVLLVNTMLNGLGEDSRHFDAAFTDVSGLRVGDDVKVAGVRVGRVDSIEATEDGATVGFELADQQRLLGTTKLVMRYQNLIGQRYLAMVQGPFQGNEMSAGSTVPVGRTDPGFDLTELLNGFRPLFEILQPGDVNRLATSMVQVLQGEGGTVEGLLQQTTQLTNFVSDRDELYGQVLTNLTPVLDNLAGQDDQLSTTIRTLKDLMTGLARDRASIGDSIDGVSRLVGTTSQFLRDVRTPAVNTIRRFVTVSEMLADSREDLNGAISQFSKIFEGLGRAGSYENALNVYPCSLLIALGNQQINPIGNNPSYSKVCQ